MKLTPVDITSKFVEALNQKFKGKEGMMGPIVFYSMAGKDYDKITLPKWDGNPEGTAHAFIERKTGKLFRAASWKLPVVDARYDLTDKEDFARAIELADPFGNYLVRNYSRKTYTGLTPSYKPAPSYKPNRMVS